VNWVDETRERERRERAAAAPPREPDPVLHHEDEETAPAKPTPRLNRAKAWRAEMMRSDAGGAAA
jgi:hypothetical protein